MENNKKEKNKVQKDAAEISPKKAAAIAAVLAEVIKEKTNYKIISIQKINPLWKR